MFRGLFAPTNAPREQTNSGSFTISVTSNGALSGYLLIGSERIPLFGKFDALGEARVVSTSGRGNRLTTILNILNVNSSDKSIQGAVTDDSFTATLCGDEPASDSIGSAGDYRGQYVFDSSASSDSDRGSLAIASGTVKVNAAGNVFFTVRLTDGNAVCGASVVSKDGCWPLYSPVYGAGSLWGWNQFTNHAVVSIPPLSLVKNYSRIHLVCRF